MSRLEQLIAARDAYQAQLDLASTSATAAGAKPNGPSGVDHEGFKKGLRDTIDWYDQEIAKEEGPQEFFSMGRST